MANHLSLAVDENLRRALGSALRALEERRSLAKKLEEQAERNRHPHLAASWARRSRDSEHELAIIRDAIDRLDEIAARGEHRRAAE